MPWDYHFLNLAPSTPHAVAMVLRQVEQTFFQDIRCLLRLPLPNHQLGAGCNFVLAQTVLLLIGGVSTVLYSQTGPDRSRFVGVLTDYYPWASDPGSEGGEWAAEQLYVTYRNPMAHALGIVDTQKKNRRTFRTTPAGPRVAIGKDSLTESEIEALEVAATRPSFLGPTLHLTGVATLVLHPATLYWGLRRMIEALSCDPERMRAAESFMLTSGEPNAT